MIPFEYVQSIYVHLGLVETVFVVYCSCKKTLCSLTVQYDWLVSIILIHICTLIWYSCLIVVNSVKNGTHLQHVTVLPL